MTVDYRHAFLAAQERLLQRYEVEAASRFVDVDAVSGPAHVLVAGDGPPLALVPGLADPAAMWAPFMARLSGFSLFAVDRPGFGLTGRARHATSTLRTLAVDFLEQALDALGLERPILVGNSMGSLWSLWLALDRPDRLAAMVHIGCPALLLGTSAPFPVRALALRPVGRVVTWLAEPSPAQVRRFARMVGEDLTGERELVDLLVEAQRLPGARSGLLDLLHAALRLTGARPEVALRDEELARIRQPTLFVWGERDSFGGPEVGEAAARIMPDATLQVVSGAGHLPWVSRPGPVAEVVRAFLNGKVWPGP